MNVAFSPRAWAEFCDWEDDNKKISKKIKRLIKEIKRNPGEGAGKPERLKHDLAGYWSRHVNDEHRLVYKVDEETDPPTLLIPSCRQHY